MTNILHKIKIYIGFYLCIERGPRHQSSNWATQFLAPALDRFGLDPTHLQLLLLSDVNKTC